MRQKNSANMRRTGRPLGNNEFIEMAEKLLKRDLGFPFKPRQPSLRVLRGPHIHYAIHETMQESVSAQVESRDLKTKRPGQKPKGKV